MLSRIKLWHGRLAAPLSALLVALSVAVPMLDGPELRHETVVESQHDPGRCTPSHDHTICTQTGANLAAPALAPDGFVPFLRGRIVPRPPLSGATSSSLSGPRSRAPPRA